MTTERSKRISLTFDWDKLIGVVEVPYRKISADIRHDDPQVTKFCTRSSYCGFWPWEVLEMCITGSYIYPYPVRYEGQIHDGQFEGKGTLYYPMGMRLRGIWQGGRLIKYQYISGDGMPFDEKSDYCQNFNRVFANPNDLQPAGRELRYKQETGRVIDEACYDTNDGFYDPKTRRITFNEDKSLQRKRSSFFRFEPKEEVEEEEEEAFNMSNIIIVTEERAKWIEERCRKAWDEPSGYVPEKYEYWLNGHTKKWPAIMDEAAFTIAPYRTASLGASQMDLFEMDETYTGTGRQLIRKT